MDKVLSVIVPAYNVDQYLMKCIESMLVSEFLHDIEIIIVNDGSTDETGTIAEAYQAQYPDTVRVINKSNGGHGSTINYGIKEATGKYLRCIDGDDWVDGRAFAMLIDELKKAEEDVVVTKYATYDDASGKMLPEDRYDIYRYVVCDRPYTFEEICHLPYIRIHQLNYRTSLLKESALWLDEFCYYVDVEYALFPMPYVKSLRFLDLSVCCYRVGRAAQSMSIEYMQRYEDNHRLVLDRVMEFYQGWKKKEECSPELLQYLETELGRLVVTQARIWLSFPAQKKYKEKILALGDIVKKEYPRIAKRLPSKTVRVLFATGGFGYSLVSFAVRKKYNVK